MTFAELIELAGRLVYAYGVNAWPFALAHLIIGGFLALSIRTLRRETRTLMTWQPGDDSAGVAAGILTSFVTDSGRLGQRGFVVPITDYSDRLDSQIQNIIDEISERTNMLLIVGIAGTLFGVFEFAARTQVLKESDRLALMGGILADSIAKAFPVGFVGLALMLAFQLALALPIAHLHQASSDATRRALEHRGEVSLTLADAIAESISGAIAESMQPVSTLGETVSEHLQPIVVTLGDRLEQSLALVTTQFGAIDQSTQRFTDATVHLQKSAVAMTTTSDELRRVMASAPSVLAKTSELQTLQHRALEQIERAFTRDLQIASHVTETLNNVSSAIAELPEAMVRQTASAVHASFENVASHSIETWRTLSEDLRAELQLQTASLVIETREEIQKVQQQVASAAGEWQRLAGASEAMITTPLANALREIDRSTSDVADKFASVVVSLQSVHSKLETLPDDLLRQTDAAIGPAFASIANTSMTTWHHLVGKVAVDLQNDFTNYVARTFEEVTRANAQMHAAGSEMQRVAEQTVSFLTEPMKTAIESARAGASSALAEVDKFVRESYPGLKSDMERFAAELRIATETLAKTGERLRAASPTHDSAHAQQEVVAILREINRQLEAMRPRRFPWRRLMPHNWFEQ